LLPEGALTLGVRAHDLSLAPLPQGVALAATVRVAEIAGSESFVHLARPGGADIVVQAPGVHRHEPDTALPVWLDPRRAFAFAPGGALLAAPGGGL